MNLNDQLDLLSNLQQSLSFLELRVNRKISELQVQFVRDLAPIKQQVEAARLTVLEELNQQED